MDSNKPQDKKPDEQKTQDSLSKEETAKMEKKFEREEIPKVKMSLMQKGLPRSLLTFGLISAVVALSIAYTLGWISFDFSKPPTFLFWLFSGFFIFIGLLLGIVFGDKNIRVVFLRNATKKNFGFVNFVSRGRYIFTQIKNLDDDFVLSKKSGMWLINYGKIYKHKNVNEEYNILDKHISMTGGIPEIFLDIDTMEPLEFHKQEGTDKFDPDRVGAATKTAIAVETAKGLLGNKTAALLGIIAVIASAAAAYFSYDSNQFLHGSVEPLIPAIQSDHATLTGLQTQLQQNQIATGSKSSNPSAIIGGTTVSTK